MARRLALVLCALGLPLVARAQSTTAGSGMCTGMMTGTIGLAVPQGNGNFLTIPSSQITTGVFGAAECQCSTAPNNPNINIEIKLTTPFPASTAATAEIWVGDTSCTNATTRTSSSNTSCQRIAPPIQISIQDFTVNSTATSASGLHYVLPADALTSPFKHSCDPATAQMQSANNVYVFIFTDVNNPLATCSLTLSERLQPPDAVINPGGNAGDGAVTLTWTPPSPGTFAPSFFQILCSDDCGNPIQDSPNTQIYSVCNNGVLSRRDLTMGGTSPGTGGADAGTTTSTDLGTMALRTNLSGRLPWQPDVAACPPDAGTSGDGGLFAGGSLGPLASLDPRFVCSDQLTPSQNSFRVGKLNNFQTYHFVVLSVDAYGNATASPVITAAPQPTEDLWRRYRDAGGGGGGCFIATAAFGSYENRWVYVLRDFRDQVLLVHGSGRSFVEWYYAHSPPLAAWIGEHGWARAGTRLALVPVIAAAWFWLYVPPVQKALVVTLLLGFLFRRRVAAAVRRTTA
jgi:hypothetical protein